MNKGIFCISIDTELLWGRKDLNYSKFISKTLKENEIIKKLLEIFKKYDIPSTWAIVGKLYEGNDPLWSGKNIIRMIKQNSNQEIASHSYSHEIFTQISRNEAEKEIKDNIAKSFVFPRNEIAYLDILKKYGFKAFRGKDKTNLELLIPRIPPTYKIKNESGLINIPGSMYFVSARGVKKYIPNNLRYFKCKLGIEKAISEKEIFHLWFHPIDFADKTNSLFKELEYILKYADQKRKEGKLEIKNMHQIVKSLES